MKLFTVTEAATFARLSTKTLRRAIGAADRPLRCYRVGRRIVISEDDLIGWLERHRAAVVLSDDIISGAISSPARELLGRLRRGPWHAGTEEPDTRQYGLDAAPKIRFA
jgi:excisionase family DNA binding protein